MSPLKQESIQVVQSVGHLDRIDKGQPPNPHIFLTKFSVAHFLKEAYFAGLHTKAILKPFFDRGYN
jgi:hypothetical protein